jgi:ParB/RepB/Spo0J family partition protein
MADLDSTANGVVAVAHPPEPEPEPEREYALVPLDRIQVHPLNLRRELRGIDELADSISQNGLLEPVLLVPAAEPAEDGSERFVLVAGHRRHAGCIAAKHSPVESIIRRDLDSEGAQVIAMLTENGPRDDLTPIEEAHGYQLALGLNHLTPVRLAKRLGKPRDRIVGRLALTKLPAHIQDKVHAHQISLGEAEAMVEFANDPAAIEALVGSVGRSSFRYRIEEQRQRRAVVLRAAAARRQLQEAGVRIIERPQDYSWRSTERPVGDYINPGAQVGPDERPVRFTPEAHAAACAFHAAFINSYDSKPEHVCTDPTKAGHESIHPQATPVATPPTPDDADHAVGDVDDPAAEAERRRLAEEARQFAEQQQRLQAEAEQAKAEREQALEVAGRLRATFLASTVQRGGKAHLAAILRMFLTDHFIAWLDDASLEDIDDLASLIDAKLTPDSDEDGTIDDRMAVVERDLRGALDSRRSADAMANALLAMIGLDREFALRQGFGWGDARCQRYMQFLVAQGYEPTEIERELLDRDDPETSDGPAVATA